MQILDDFQTFFLVFAFGMISILIHCYSLYYTDASTHDASFARRHWKLILPVASHQAPNELMGFAYYVISVAIIYTLLVVSSTKLFFLLHELATISAVGPVLSNDINLNELVPILTAMVVITTSRIRPFSNFEIALRSISHHIAGRRYTLEVYMQRLINFDYSILLDDKAGPSTKFARNIGIQVLRFSKFAGHDEIHSKDIYCRIVRVYALRSWIFSDFTNHVWAGLNHELVDDYFPSLDDKFKELDLTIRSLVYDHSSAVAKNSVVQIRDYWHEIDVKSSELEDEFIGLFVLLSVRKNGRVRLDDDEIAFNSIIRRIEHGVVDQETKIAFLSGFLGTACAILVIVLGHIFYDVVEAFRLEGRTVFDQISTYGVSNFYVYGSIAATFELGILLTATTIVSTLTRSVIQADAVRISYTNATHSTRRRALVASFATGLFVGLASYLYKLTHSLYADVLEVVSYQIPFDFKALIELAPIDIAVLTVFSWFIHRISSFSNVINSLNKALASAFLCALLVTLISIAPLVNNLLVVNVSFVLVKSFETFLVPLFVFVLYILLRNNMLGKMSSAVH